MGERVGDIGVAVWIALEKAHQGEVSHLASQWLDSANPEPGYLADALNRLTHSGQLALAAADPQSPDARRVTVTDAGRARYEALCRVHIVPAPLEPAHSAANVHGELRAARSPEPPQPRKRH